MAGKSTRDKGRRGESEAKRLLAEKDWEILADTTAGLATGDLIAHSPDGLIYDVEVKNRVEKQVARLRAELLVKCPACGEDFDLFDEDDGQFLKPIFNNDWDALIGADIECPSCGHWIEIEEVEW